MHVNTNLYSYSYYPHHAKLLTPFSTKSLTLDCPFILGAATEVDLPRSFNKKRAGHKLSMLARV